MFTRRCLLASTGLAVLAVGTTPAVPAKARNGRWKSSEAVHSRYP